MKSKFIIIFYIIFTNSILLAENIFIESKSISIDKKKQIKDQQEAKNHIRDQWDEMGPSNPHSAAHFGTYAFKSNSILNSLDEGVNAVTGLVLRLEGHKQNEVAPLLTQ